MDTHPHRTALANVLRTTEPRNVPKAWSVGRWLKLGRVGSPPAHSRTAHRESPVYLRQVLLRLRGEAGVYVLSAIQEF